MLFPANQSLLLEMVAELRQPKANRLIILEGPAAARSEFAAALAARLNSSLQRAVTPGTSLKDSILFFDEADSLFGERSSVKDAHDRYANQSDHIVILGVENASGLPPYILERAKRVVLKER